MDSLDFDIILTDDVFITSQTPITPDPHTDALPPYMDALKNETANTTDPLDKLSMVKAYYYNPKAFLDKPITTIPLDIRKEILTKYLTDNNIPILSLFNWYMDSIVRITNYILVNVLQSQDTIEYSTSLGTSYLKITPAASTDTSDSSDSSSSTPPPPTYQPLLKFNGQYISYYSNGSVDLTDDQGTQTPNPSTQLSDDDMLNIIVNNINIKLHGFKKVNATYSDNSKVEVISYPYFYPPYGLQANFKYNKKFTNIRNGAVNTTKTLTAVDESYYLYLYIHLSGYYFTKVFVSYPDLTIMDISKQDIPYTDTSFFNTQIPLTLDTLNNSTPIEINLEKANMPN